MGLFNRKPKLPPAARPPLAAEERVLAWAAVGNGEGDGVVVASNLGLWLPGRGHRIGWHDILKAVWSGRELTVTPAERVAERDGYLVVADCPAETYLLLDPGDLPHQVRARVTRSVAYTSHHPVPGGAGRIAARRVSGVDGLTWTVRYDPGTPADDEAVLAETDRLVAAARSATAPANL
ncbi:hypothetical protein ONA91_24640 [Micromonospora sp. DR5-3]|uniref:hypothetical protein n=1 Tax=unclassified Micromonospora TaxID=2617518 RepID=UPI0011DAEE1B|nr:MULTISPECIES: hypothetical protein [unclassified Micromonospora]MCW3817647.1 hypothetical protein [Micromonospora sp. DR5-3]TYC20600.1 hypothetical protein FXF52_30490 [Micromonospora sp. MP36]